MSKFDSMLSRSMGSMCKWKYFLQLIQLQEQVSFFKYMAMSSLTPPIAKIICVKCEGIPK